MARPHWLIILGLIGAVILALLGAVLYPLPDSSFIDIVLYEIPVFLGIGLLLYLINSKALPEEQTTPRKPWP